MVGPGDPFPDFVLVDDAGVEVSTADLAGSWFLLYWYPKADTPGCTAQAEGLRDQQEAFDESDCRVLGASFDEPVENARFRNRHSLPFSLLSDLDHTVAARLGVVDDPSASHARRVAHLVRPDGTVAVRYEVDDPEFFAEQVLDDLDAERA